MEWFFVGLGIYVVYSLFRKKEEKQSFSENNRYSESDDSDLTEFRITAQLSYYNEEETKNKHPGRWINLSEIVQVGGVEIKGGFIYFGGQLRSEDDYGYSTEASLIDSTLKINMGNPDYGGSNMGYWPRYNRISPTSRAAYIKWLAGSRDDPNTYIGYVFLYFYGIERRLLVDDKEKLVSEQECKVLIEEVIRLKNIYGACRSFNGYSSNFLSYIYFLHPNIVPPKDNDLLLSNNLTAGLKYTLGKTVNEGRPIPADLALAWVRGHPEIRLRTAARRCEKEFNQLFEILYKDKFQEGFSIKPNKKKIKIEYRPASDSLSLQSVTLDLPDVTLLKGPRDKLEEVSEACMKALDPYNRFLGRARTQKAKNSLNAVALLPGELAPYIKNKKFSKVKTLITTQSDNLISVKSILEHLDDKVPSNINKKTAEALALLVEKMGMGMVPDIRFHSAKPNIEGKVAVFAGGHGADFLPSVHFKQIEVVLHLGAIIAASDNNIDPSEIKILEGVIAQNNKLSDVERRSLNAYLHWALHEPMSASRLKKRLTHLNDEQKQKIKRILIYIIVADGKIQPAEVKQLEKFYAALGSDKSIVSSDISSFLSGAPLEARQARKQHGATEQPVQLDANILKKYERDTQDVQELLKDIFAEDIPEVAEPQMDDEGVDETKPLEKKYSRLYNVLITKEKWEIEEVKFLCKEQNLMMEGAIEGINDWAFNLVSAPVVESNALTIVLDLEIVEEIEALQKQVSA